MSWLEDLFFLVAFAMAVVLVTFSVYDGNAYPTVGAEQIVATSENAEREMPPTRHTTEPKTASRSIAVAHPGNAAPVH